MHKFSNSDEFMHFIKLKSVMDMEGALRRLDYITFNVTEAFARNFL